MLLARNRTLALALAKESSRLPADTTMSNATNEPSLAPELLSPCTCNSEFAHVLQNAQLQYYIRPLLQPWVIQCLPCTISLVIQLALPCNLHSLTPANITSFGQQQEQSASTHLLRKATHAALSTPCAQAPLRHRQFVDKLKCLRSGTGNIQDDLGMLKTN